jgi:hypothetical protein
MLRKLGLYAILAVIIAAVAYGWLNYAIVGLYDKDTPKVTYLFVVPKPERDTTLFYNHIDENMVTSELRKLKDRNRPVPWHLDYDYVVNRSIYHFTLDSRQ